MANCVQQFVLDEEEDSPYVIISCLNFISEIEPGYVIESSTMQLYENTPVNRLYRTVKNALNFKGGDRDTTLLFFKRVISAAFGFIEPYLDSQDADRIQIGALGFRALRSSIGGLKNHQKTYTDKGDTGHASQIKVLIDTITYQIPSLQKKADAVYPSDD